MGDRVDELLDDLNAFVWRLYELPIAVLLLVALAAAALALLLLWSAARRKGRRFPWMAAGFTVLVLLQLAPALVADRRSLRLEKELRLVRGAAASIVAGDLDSGRRAEGAAAATVEEGSADPSQPQESLSAAPRGILGRWPVAFAYLHRGGAPGVDYDRLSLKEPLAVVHVAAVDLDAGDCEVVLPAPVSRKTVTSAFSARAGALVAVNEEAGVSPGMRARLAFGGRMMDHTKRMSIPSAPDPARRRRSRTTPCRLGRGRSDVRPPGGLE